MKLWAEASAGHDVVHAIQVASPACKGDQETWQLKQFYREIRAVFSFVSRVM